MMKTGVSAQNGATECYRDVSPTIPNLNDTRLRRYFAEWQPASFRHSALTLAINSLFNRNHTFLPLRSSKSE